MSAHRTFADADKDFIVADIHNRFTRWFRGRRVDAACLYWAALTRDYLNERYDVGAELRAGTACWRFNAHDDGHTPTHFSYVWDPDSPLSRAMLERGLLPEMHCWVSIPRTGEVVDLTTRYLVFRAAQAGMKWTAPEPPPFLWTDKLPDGVIYAADTLATTFAGALLALST